MKRSLLLLISLLTITTSITFGQTKAQLDSLSKIMYRKDTVGMNAMLEYGIAYKMRDPKKSIRLFKKLIATAKKQKRKDFQYKGYNEIASTYSIQGETELSQKYFDTTLVISASYDSLAYATILTNLGNLYIRSGELEQALDRHMEARGIKQRHKAYNKMLSNTLSIATAYKTLKQTDLGFKYAYESLELSKKYNKNPAHLSSCLQNLASLHIQKENYDSSTYYLNSAIELPLPTLSKGILYHKIGVNYFAQEKYEEALDAFKQSLEIAEELESLNGIVANYNYIGNTLYGMERDREALPYVLKSIEYGKITKNQNSLMDSYKVLSNIYYELGDKDKAFDYLEKHIDLKDSVFNADFTDKIATMQAEFDVAKQEHDNAILLKEQEKDKLEIKKQQDKNTFITIGSILAVILLAVSLFAYRRSKKANKLIRSQKAEVEEQRDLVKVKNKEITDSLIYAKRIQGAILPPDNVVSEHFADHFILYKPKDIVSGDFYWLHWKGNQKFFAVADCTGHGVPGAMVSVICNNGLNRSVQEFNETKPGAILDKTRELVINEFEKSDDADFVKDGMDIALCTLSGNQLQFAGAHNPLWIVRKDADDIEEIKGNKQPVGFHPSSTPFDTHEIELNSGDTVYLFSDGYVDQFGGEKGKKFMSKNFRNLILSIQHLSMKEQRKAIDEALLQWQGNHEQLDDICVFGVRIS